MNDYTGRATLWTHSQGTSGHARGEDAASVYGYTGTLCENRQGRVQGRAQSDKI